MQYSKRQRVTTGLQKRPVVLKRGFSNFIDPLSPDELAGLAMESEIDSRLVSHQDG
ncbi:hypothetical protein ONO12_27890, partial [Salmonella enterica subsp. enterica serovar Montevideo]|nr:hypothetical protein [Salmonella enterica subsp. enterica serovar Montevideo]